MMNDFSFGKFSPTKSFGILVLLSVAIGVPALLIVRALDPDLVLAALSVLLFTGAAVSAGLAFMVRTEPTSQDLNWWDVAGGLVLTGCAASVFGEPENVALLFEHLFERQQASQ
jgi:hypothetical protein